MVSLPSIATVICCGFLPDLILLVRLGPREGSTIGGRPGIGVHGSLFEINHFFPSIIFLIFTEGLFLFWSGDTGQVTSLFWPQFLYL